MKTILASMLLISSAAFAAPVINENMAPTGVVTIYPDHIDPNRYYVAPNVVTVSKNESGVPYFSLMRYRSLQGENVGLVQMTLMPQYSRSELELAEKAILDKNPNAKFSGLPFSSSTLDFEATYLGLIKSHNCSHLAGLIGQEQSCSFLLNRRGVKVFLDGLREKKLLTTFSFHYSVEAMDRQADGSYKPFNFQMGVAVRIDGGQLKAFPQLFK